MNKKLIMLFCIAALPCVAFSANDNQEYWTWATFDVPLSQNWSARIREDFRFPAGGLKENQNIVQFNYKGFSDNLDLGLGYRLVNTKDSKGNWLREHRPYLDATYKTQIFGLKLSDRNRIEYREHQNKKDLFRYRNQIKLLFPNPSPDIPVSPYIAWEIFIQETVGHNRTRLQPGLIYKINDKTNLNLFWIFQSDRDDPKWDNTLISGIELSFSF